MIKLEDPGSGRGDGGDIMRWAGHPPEGAPRGMGPIYLTINRNKRSVLIDLGDPKARKTLVKLIKSCDVFASSVRYAGLKRLGLAYEDVAAIRPDIVYVHAAGYGSDGPYAGEPAYDDLIQSASGMADAGRIQHHLRNNLIRANATVLFVGYQAPGTLGQIILSGAREVRIHGELVPVQAHITSLGTYSAHADHSELMAWIKARLPAHGALFLTHGEDDERVALRDALVAAGDFGGDQVILPLLDDAVDLLATGVAGVRRPAVPRADLRQMSSDWNNAYQALLVDLEEGLRKAPSDEARLALMQKVRRTLAPTGILSGPPPSKGIGTDVRTVNPILSGGETGGE